jgi:hypothetical protein
MFSRAITVLFTSLLLVGLGVTLVSVSAQTAFVTVPLPSSSVRNKVLDFYAGGSAEGYTFRASPQGTTLAINGLGVTTLTAWGYVSAQWSLGPVYIIFLANVSQTDFKIGFLYLTNVTNQPFILRWFDYGSGALTSWTFQGVQHVYNRTVTTLSVDMPKLQIVPESKISSPISALGPDMYLASIGGKLQNSTKLLNIYPIHTQLFAGSTDYNEVWSLLTDPQGGYYFTILYMQNSDTSHVLVEHLLRLNDYKTFDGRTVDARWIKGSLPNQVTVRTGQSNLTVTINDFPFQTNERGMVTVGVPNSRVKLEVPSEIQNSAQSRLHFSSWKNFGSENPLRLLLNSSLDITANYTHEYSLTIATQYGTPSGAGWYTQGTNVTFGVQSEIDSGNGTKVVFENWQGASNSTSNQTWTVMNSAEQANALWKKQYRITLTPVGLPDNVTTQVIVNNSMVTINGSKPYTVWADANSPLSIGVQSTEIEQSATNYYYAGLRVDNQTVMGSLTITKPLEVMVTFTGVPKAIINVNLDVSPTVAAPGYPVKITGSIQSMPKESTSVSLLYSLNDVNWERIANVSVSPDGTFSYKYPFNQPGNYYLRVFWPGDSKHSSASQVVNVRIVDSTMPIISTSDPLAPIVTRLVDAFYSVPYASSLLSFAGTMIAFGYILTSFIIPGGSPFVGYIIGSLLIGFIYVFPPAAVLAVVRAVASHRRPSLLWVTPLVGLWLLSTGLLVGSYLYSTMQPLALMAEVLLLICNMFLLPVASGIGVARAVT